MKGARGHLWAEMLEAMPADSWCICHSVEIRGELDSGFENFFDSQFAFLVHCGLLVLSWFCSGVSGEFGEESMEGAGRKARGRGGTCN